MNGMYPGAYSGIGVFRSSGHGHAIRPRKRKRNTGTQVDNSDHLYPSPTLLCKLSPISHRCSNQHSLPQTRSSPSQASLTNSPNYKILESVLCLPGLVRRLRDIMTGLPRREFRELFNGHPMQGPTTRPSQSPPLPKASEKDSSS